MILAFVGKQDGCFGFVFRVSTREGVLRLARCFQQSDLALPTGGLSNPIVRMGRSPAHVQASWA